MPQKKILFFTFGSRKDASTRYRVYQYLPYLEGAGYQVQIEEPAAKRARGLSRLRSTLAEERRFLSLAREADLIFIQRRLFSIRFLKKLEKLHKRILFDFDDAIFTSPSGNWSFLTQRRVQRRLQKTFGISAWILAGNKYLKSMAEKFGARAVRVLPTVIDLSKYRLKQHGSNGSVVLGWIGSSSNYPYLQALETILRDLSREFPEVKVLVVSDKTIPLKGSRVENRPWSEDREGVDLLEMDIGLMPLVDDVWSRGKCALKALQYMACGIPAVCSNLGTNRELILPGEDGYLVGSDREWLEALRELIQSPEKRERMGLAARKKVEQHFMLQKTSGVLLRTLEDIP